MDANKYILIFGLAITAAVAFRPPGNSGYPQFEGNQAKVLGERNVPRRKLFDALKKSADQDDAANSLLGSMHSGKWELSSNLETSGKLSAPIHLSQTMKKPHALKKSHGLKEVHTRKKYKLELMQSETSVKLGKEQALGKRSGIGSNTIIRLKP